MTAPLLAGLLVFAVLVGCAGAARLSVAGWVTRAPGAAMRLWIALALSNLVTVLTALVLVSHDVFEQFLIWAFRADKGELHLAYAGAGPVDPAWNGAALVAGAVLAGAVCVGVVEWVRSARSRRDLRDYVARAAVETVAGRTVLVLPGRTLEAFCVPSRREGLIFVSKGMIYALSAPQLAAAVEHEAAHLVRKHHRWVLLADVLGRVLAPLRLCLPLREAMRTLVELDADDLAAQRAGLRPLAQALLLVANAQGPFARPWPSAASELALGAEQPGLRVQRLVQELSDNKPRSSWERRVVDVVLPVLVIAPAVCAVLPGASLWGSAG